MRKEELMQRFDADAVIELCRNLVRIPSENPPGDTTALAAYVRDYLLERGLPAEIVAPKPHMPNVVCTVEGTGGGRHLVFNGHLDTYPAGEVREWTRPPFEASVENGRMYGRGVADMKAGVACSIYAFCLLAEHGGWPGKLSLVLVSDEETGGTWGTEYLLRERPELRGDALLNGEPSACEMVSMGEKGTYWVRLTARNKGGHGAFIYQQRNAIDTMLSCIADLRAYETLEASLPASARREMERAEPVFDRLRGDGASRALQRFSLNVGILRGGLNVNTQPEICEAELDFRVPPGGSLQQAKDFVASVLRRHPDVTLELIKETEPTLSSPDNALLKAVRANADAVRGEETVVCFTFGGTDARYWRLYGVPAAVYGPNHHHMGSADEHIAVEDLITAAKVHAGASWDYLTEET